MTPYLTKGQRRTLRALARGPIYRGAVRLLLEGKVAAPGRVLAQLERRGFVEKGRTEWSITDSGREIVRQLDESAVES